MLEINNANIKSIDFSPTDIVDIAIDGILKR